MIRNFLKLNHSKLSCSFEYLMLRYFLCKKIDATLRSCWFRRLLSFICTDSMRMRQANTQRPHRSSGRLRRTPTPGAAALHAPFPIPRHLLSSRWKSVQPQGRRPQGTTPLLPPPRALLSGGPIHGDNSACRWSAVGSTCVGPNPLTHGRLICSPKASARRGSAAAVVRLCVGG